MTKFLRLAEHKSLPDDVAFAQSLRQRPTSGEKVLWLRLREATKGSEVRFRRQHPIHPYVVDFVCLRLRLVVEVDGASHEAAVAGDIEREDYLRQSGYEIMRFTNNDVVRHCDGVVSAILARVSDIEMRCRNVPLT